MGAASRSTKRSTHARPGMHMQRCSAVPLIRWFHEHFSVCTYVPLNGGGGGEEGVNNMYMCMWRKEGNLQVRSQLATMVLAPLHGHGCPDGSPVGRAAIAR
jgi:hypothetical protein